MDQISIGEVSKSSKLEGYTREELIQRYIILQDEITRLVKENYELRNQNVSEDQLQFLINEQLDSLKETFFGAKSERYKKPKVTDKPKTPPKPRIKKPSERYPNIPVRENVIPLNPIPQCLCCGETMEDSGMTEDSEQLTIIPKKYEIILQKRVKYRCRCHESIVTAPNPPRIIEGSTYSDEMIQDVVLSKYCDLIPIERYAAMAGRSGLVDLPRNSLIELTHSFADFVAGAYQLLKKDILNSRVLHADETPHQMLEGSNKKSWYLWGFSNDFTCYLECRDTRSGDVASDILLQSICEILISDVFSGYAKATRIANKERTSQSKRLIQNAYCNAHSRRYFIKALKKFPEAVFYLDHYHEIYQLDSKSKGQAPPEILKWRAQMKIRFAEMKDRALQELGRYPAKSNYGKALNYFLENYSGLTLFLSEPEVDIDNNSQERLLRGHVVGRKTWYGTHSERGAFTAAVLFSLVETCKLNHVNPREYFKCLVEDLLAGEKPYTPKTFKTP